MPNVSMNPAHNYKTQSSAYDRLLIGALLTDRRITQLQKAGYYGSGLVLPCVPRPTGKARKGTPRRTVEQLLKRYGI